MRIFNKKKLHERSISLIDVQTLILIENEKRKYADNTNCYCLFLKLTKLP